MRPRCVLVLLLLVAVAVPAVAWARPGLRATDVRVGAHPGFVRIVVEFRGSDELLLGEVELTSRPDRLLRAGRAGVAVRHPGIRSEVTGGRGHGVRVRVTRRSGRLLVGLSTARQRFKALQEKVLRGPKRLVLDLWRAAPPGPAATVRADGCLALDAFTVSAGSVRARGRALRRLFENSLVVEVRAASGRSVGSRAATAVRGRWRRTVPYAVARAQRGTLEAAVYSAKDGSLECLVQAPVTLRP